MPIDFACPSCSRQYRVKDELAGKNAKCGKCGHRMPIPQLAASASMMTTPRAPVAAPSSAAKPAAKSASTNPVPIKSVSVTATQKAKSNAAAHSWLDEELEASQTVVKAPLGPRTPCPSCGQPLTTGAVLCVACGYDTRSGKKLETKHEADAESEAVGKKRQRPRELGYAASLLRGTVFSFLGAMLGATLWAVFAYLTMWESGYIALALGGLTGFGMALGHEDEDGTTAGIIAAFMSLFGIVAAKVLIVVIIIASFVGQVIQEVDPVERKRMSLEHVVAGEKLRAEGIDVAEATDEQWEEAYAKAEAEVNAMSEQELDVRFQEFTEQAQLAEDADPADKGIAAADENINPPKDAEAPAVLAADEGNKLPVDANAAAPDNVELEQEPSPVSLFFKIMFSPIDGIFILLAFFTAYKVGSGEMTD